MPDAIRQLVDIEPPAPPPDHTGLWLWMAFAACILLVTLRFAWRRFASPRGRALRRLAHLQARLDTAEDGTLAFHIAAILRQGLNLPRLDADRPPARGAARWRTFIGRLDQARYAPGASPPDTLRDLLREARYWLRTWR